MAAMEGDLPSNDNLKSPPKPLAKYLHMPTMPWAHHVASPSEEYNKQQTLPVENAILTTAPNVPPPINRRHPVLLKVDLTTELKKIQIDPKFKYEAWTFNGSVPGPMIRARVGDVVELSLTNLDTNGNPHNIDCHGFEGPGGGSAVTLAQENETKTARFKLLYPGLFVYHCAAAPVPVHVANGMYGLMLIEPENPTLPVVEKEYYVMQSEYYVEPLERLPNGKLTDTAEFSYPRGLQEDADLVVFNGKEGAMTRDAPLKAQTGDRVRIYFGNAGPNLTSSLHLIGGIFDRVYRDGDLVSHPGRFIQTISVPPGGSSIVDMHMLIPGTYALVDHALFRLDKGCVGFLNVAGPARPDLYHSEQPPEQCTGCKLHN
jgi:copper-containing nitrite reductase